MNTSNSFPSVSLERGSVVLDISFIGEGYSGDYDPSDSVDSPLLRFDFSIKDEDGIVSEVSDGSFCTNLHAERPISDVESAAELILNLAFDELSKSGRAKHLCECLSHASWDWVEYCRSNNKVCLPTDYINFLSHEQK